MKKALSPDRSGSLRGKPSLRVGAYGAQVIFHHGQMRKIAGAGEN